MTRPAGGVAAPGTPAHPPEGSSRSPSPWAVAPAPGRTPRALTATPDGVPLADLGSRLAARLVDWSIKTVLSIVIGFNFLQDAYRVVDRWLSRQSEAAPPDLAQLVADQGLTDASLGFQVIAILVSLVYTVPMIALRGATPGKLLLGVRVRPLAGEGQPGWGRSLMRWATREGMRSLPYVGAVYLLVDSVWPLRDPARQALHDKLPATVVVRSRS